MGVLKQSISSVSGAASEQAPQADPNLAGSILDDPGQFLNALLPWAISLVFHVMIFLLMFLVVWVVRVTGMDEPLPLSEARLTEYLDDTIAPGLQNPDLQLPDEIVPFNRESTAEQKLDLLSEVTAVNKSDISIIGIGAGAASGDLTKYGLTTAGLGEGPSFFGLGRGALHARKICYVVDRSGSMVDELDYVKEEVMRSINRLHRVQQFHVIFFSGGPPIEAPPKRFVHAIKEYKKQAFEFLSMIEAGGSTEPSKAMSRAIRLGADLIYFLTDGEFAPTLVEQLKKWNKDQKVRIYTIAFLRRNGEDLLRQIARQNGGEFRFISEDDLD